jgi:hypothetical protein
MRIMRAGAFVIKTQEMRAVLCDEKVKIVRKIKTRCLLQLGSARHKNYMSSRLFCYKKIVIGQNYSLVA